MYHELLLFGNGYKKLNFLPHITAYRIIYTDPRRTSPRHHLFHFIRTKKSTSKVEDLIERTGLRRNSVFKLICLPPISRRGGCALLQPAPVPSPTTTTPDGSDDDCGDDCVVIDDDGDDDASSSRARSDEDDANIVKSILDALGGYVECRDDSVMDAMMVTTCMMGPMYGVMRNNRDWLGEFGVLTRRRCGIIGLLSSRRLLADYNIWPELRTLTATNSNHRITHAKNFQKMNSSAVDRGVSPEDASYFVGRSYLSMVQDAERDCDVNPRRFDDLIEEQTPGGLNEQVGSSMDSPPRERQDSRRTRTSSFIFVAFSKYVWPRPLLSPFFTPRMNLSRHWEICIGKGCSIPTFGPWRRYCLGCGANPTAHSPPIHDIF